jgi:hypothetical protein
MDSHCSHPGTVIFDDALAEAKTGYVSMPDLLIKNSAAREQTIMRPFAQ